MGLDLDLDLGLDGDLPLHDGGDLALDVDLDQLFEDCVGPVVSGAMAARKRQDEEANVRADFPCRLGPLAEPLATLGLPKAQWKQMTKRWNSQHGKLAAPMKKSLSSHRRRVLGRGYAQAKRQKLKAAIANLLRQVAQLAAENSMLKSQMQR
jgi:hypothetical protein